MTSRSSFRTGVAALITLLGISGCERDLDPLAPASFPSEGAVFLDEFASGLTYQAFGFSKVDALDVDEVVAFKGTAALKLTIPSASDPSGGFAGGAFVSTTPRDLTGYNALTFWAKASTAATFNLGGLGNDNTGTSKFVATWLDIPLSTTWTRYIIPIPDPAKLSQERGMFHFAEGSEYPVGYDVWIDELQYEKVGTIAFEEPTIPTQTVNLAIGSTFAVTGTQVTYDVAGSVQTIQASPAYFTFASSDPSVATVDEEGIIQVVGPGSAVITAKLGSQEATGAVTVEVSVPPEGPAPTPEHPAANVISLFSDVYTDVTVDTWSAEWDAADVADIQIQGDNVKKYSNLSFAGIEFTSQPIDASAMTRFRMDFWTPDPTDPPAAFRVKLVDFGADGAFGGGDDVEHELTFDASTTPALASGAWVSLDVPLTDFAGLTTRSHIAQLIISGDPNTVYLDNILFYKDTPAEPTEPAPTPTLPAADVVSLFSNAYTDVAVDTWSASWDAADLEEVQIAGDDTKKYANLVFAGIEAVSQPIDASTMTHFHFDFWTPDPTADPAVFKVKLVDFGSDGAFGGGDDVEHEITLNSASTPPLTTGSWVSFDIPLSEFSGLTTKGHVAQLIISGDPNTVFMDNLYFHK